MKTKEQFVIKFNTGQYLKEKVFKGCFNTCEKINEAMEDTQDLMNTNANYLKKNGYNCKVERV